MRRLSHLSTPANLTTVRTFFPELFAGFGLLCLVEAGKGAYFNKEEVEASAAELLRKNGLMCPTPVDWPETSAVPHSLRMREKAFALAASEAIKQNDVNTPDKFNFLPLQYVIANHDLDGLFTLARKGLVITPAAIELAGKAGCSENFIAALTTLYKMQESTANSQKSIPKAHYDESESAVVPFKGP